MAQVPGHCLLVTFIATTVYHANMLMKSRTSQIPMFYSKTGINSGMYHFLFKLKIKVADTS